MRRAFVDSLIDIAEKDERVVFLTGDLGFQVFDKFKARFGSRYINVGIAESELVCAAAGLALEGFRPLVYSIASFMTGRPFELIRVSIAYQHLPVVLVGAGGGYCYAHAGITHHAPDDFGLMSLLPGMTVVAPGDPNEVMALLPQLCTLDGPSYIRIGKFGEPVYQSSSPIVLGQARRIARGDRLAVLSTGEMTPVVLCVLDKLKQEGIYPACCHFHTIKPLDTSALDDLAVNVSAMIVVEETSPDGGLFNAVLKWHNNSTRNLKLVRLGPPDEFALGNYHRETLRARFSFDEGAIVNKCRELWMAG